MATPYNTPGVYIEEIVKFPPSVAQVETAIPAFIGYTEKARKKEDGDLHNVPKRIISMLEYTNFFGNAKTETSISVSVIDDVIVAMPPNQDDKSPFLMYYAMQMYFANGGGPCYIVSVGQYDSTLDTPATLVERAALEDGLAKVRKEDEPTLIVFPDATSLTDDGDFYALYNLALIQCNELQDRFTIIDTYSDKEHETSLSDSGTPYGTIEPTESIREGLNLDKDFLKYGAVYFPFLETILDYRYDETLVDVVRQNTAPEDVQLRIQKISDNLDASVFDSAQLDALRTAVDNAADDEAAVAMIPNIKNTFKGIQNQINKLVSTLNSTLDIGRNNGAATQANALDAWITTELEQAHLSMSQSMDNLNGHTTAGAIIDEIDNNKTALDTLKTSIETVIADGGELHTMIDALPTSGTTSTTSKLDALQADNNQLYNRIKSEIAALSVTLPPSAAMAGIYARVDSNRGVWKAPANVGINYVIKPSVAVSHEDQALLNIDTSGKSINAIRTFTGKGILVWGARTLAGNDNEWKYISVRRFFIMVEESVKKATEHFVFEPNDANTWIRVRAMIENFLILQWRAGALAGAKPEQAFYVRVALGETMTAEDVLNGIMNVEVGMAVVRPAEFIVLKFSHKMQEA